MGDTSALEQQAHKAALMEMGRVAVGTPLVAALVVSALAGLTWSAAAGALAWWLAIPLLGYVYFASYTPLHEAVHRNVSGGRRGRGWLDDVVGVTCGTILGVSFTLHRAEHFAHHRATNQTDVDPDKVFGQGFMGLVLGTLRIVPSQYGWFMRTVWPGLSRDKRMRLLAEVALIVLSRLVPAVMGFGAEVLWLSIVPNILGIVLTALLFAWIVHKPSEDTSRWGCTASFDFRGMLKWPVTVLWLWQNYHAIHHLFPRVPFYRYHAVFHRIDDTMVQMGAPVHRFGPAPAVRTSVAAV